MKFRAITSLLALTAVAMSPLPSAAQDTSDEALEEIVVVGIRGSIRRAENIKREAKNIVEAITTEDLGKFSDDSLREEQISSILDRLDEREQMIIISRFGLDHREEPKTLKEVGAEMGVTKERIRQIEAAAIGKLRAAMAA